MHRRPEDEAGQALVEYGLILVFVTAGAIFVLGLFGLDVFGLLQEAADAFPS